MDAVSLEFILAHGEHVERRFGHRLLDKHEIQVRGQGLALAHQHVTHFRSFRTRHISARLGARVGTADTRAANNSAPPIPAPFRPLPRWTATPPVETQDESFKTSNHAYNKLMMNKLMMDAGHFDSRPITTGYFGAGAKMSIWSRLPWCAGVRQSITVVW